VVDSASRLSAFWATVEPPLQTEETEIKLFFIRITFGAQDMRLI